MASFRKEMAVIIIPLAAVMVFLFLGATDATCAAGYKDCDKNYKSNRCEINILADVRNCGDCGMKCPTYPYAMSACKAGKCVFTCKAGWKNCNNKWSDGCEVDVGMDVNNCGGCGKKCKRVPNASIKCSNCKCMYTCNAGWKNCNNDWTDGCETEVSRNVDNCGGCGTKCNGLIPYTSTKCSNHKCEYTCKAGWKDCNKDLKDGCETDVGKDVNNCGSCGTKCNVRVPYASTKCSNHKCEYTCKAGWKDCNKDLKDGCETDVGKDVNNCGSCGTKCNSNVPYASTTCNNHKCEYTCNAGWEDCNNDMKDGCETDVGNDVSNCGGCGMKCKDVPYASAVCSGSKCEYTCEAGWANCNDDWEDGCETDVNTDVNNCGECATTCPEPKFWGGEAKCSDGICEEKWCMKGWKYSDEKKCCVEDWWPFSSGHGDK